MLNKRRFLVGACVIAAAVGYLVYAGIQTTSMYYFNIEEFVQIRAAHAGQDLRVHGWVGAGSIKWDPQTNDLAFQLVQKDGQQSVPVTYRGVLPDMFAEGREVVVEAHFANDTLAAKQIMTSCPSKYEAKPDGTPAQGS
jgi:cytochrome c-type biogenesis protein CcmE